MFIFGGLDLSQIVRILAAFSFAVFCSLIFFSNSKWQRLPNSENTSGTFVDLRSFPEPENDATSFNALTFLEQCADAMNIDLK